MSAWSVQPTWPEGTEAPTDDFLPWFLQLTEDEQLAIMFTLRQSQREASRCFQMDHDALQDQLNRMSERCRDYQERIAALDDIIVRAYKNCQCGKTEVSPS